ncbi:hypothetical protein [Aquimarina brevivitae]|uniref:Uncharacterized protein n=1 Tax=Aquimarina brevivitae TaxID=323412 RepID=A0A4Q7PJC8_9FLAO|nr:hypothetical protein [Aquimarina brevivitae]RZS99940.1 hypothetical protein EV197_1171 [Aquimarina brevivitae]
MKNIYRLKYIAFVGLFGLILTSCEDDNPVTAGIGDPLDKEIINIDATIASDVTVTGEGNVVDFTVTLPQAFSTDVTVTATARMDNGGVTTGTAEIAAGATTGAGTVTISPDDSVIDGETIEGASDALTIELTAILLDELVPGTTYTISSNELSLGIYPKTLSAAGGINILLDWNGAPGIDIDMQVIDRGFTAIFENAASGDRFEEDLFENTGRADGIYDVYVIAFTPVAAGGTDYNVLFTLPDGRLVAVNGTLPESTPVGVRIPVATFEKSTNVDTGVVSYINVGAL